MYSWVMQVDFILIRKNIIAVDMEGQNITKKKEIQKDNYLLNEGLCDFQRKIYFYKEVEIGSCPYLTFLFDWTLILAKSLESNMIQIEDSFLKQSL